MALEDLTGTEKFITSLVPANPLSGDDRREGDDHIRGIKNVLANTFPKLDGPLDYTAAEVDDGLARAFNAVQRDGDTMTGPLRINYGEPVLRLYNTDGDADLRMWQMVGLANGGLNIGRVNDGITAYTAPILNFNPGVNRWQIAAEAVIVGEQAQRVGFINGDGGQPYMQHVDGTVLRLALAGPATALVARVAALEAAVAVLEAHVAALEAP